MPDMAGKYCNRESKVLIPLKLAMTVNNVLDEFRLVRYPFNILLGKGNHE